MLLLLRPKAMHNGGRDGSCWGELGQTTLKQTRAQSIVLLLDDPSPHQTPNNTFILFNNKTQQKQRQQQEDVI
jgi:hypothetical protein